MALGTLTGRGWRIVRTMGLRIHEADADAGIFAPRPGGAATLVSWRPGSGFPFSPPRTPLPAPSVGVGRGARRGVGGALETWQSSIVYAWVITISGRCRALPRCWPYWSGWALLRILHLIWVSAVKSLYEDGGVPA